MTRTHTRSFQVGFTFIELIFVMAALAILAGIAIPIFLNYSDKARVASFVEQAEVWRKKAAIEAATSGADLCHWDNAKYGSLRLKIFGTQSNAPFVFSDYRLDISHRTSVSGSNAQGPLVADIVATATEGTRALTVARLIRTKLDELGWRLVSPSTDKDLPSIQAFSMALSDCATSGSASASTHVGAVISVGVSPQSTPQPLQSTPNTGINPIPHAPTPVCGPLQQLNADRSGCIAKSCSAGFILNPAGVCIATPRCGGGQHYDASLGTCACPGNSHFNIHAGKCVGQGH